MTATNHVLTGVVIGLTIHQPVLAIPLALVSHFALDALPHYGEQDLTSKRFKIILAVEALAITIILTVIAMRQPAYWGLAIVCGLVAASPDFMWLPNFIRDLRHSNDRKPYTSGIYHFHKAIQWAEKSYNWPYELVWLVLAIFTMAKLV